MTRRLITALRSVLVDAPSDGAVHFHFDGPNGEPSVCHDRRCTRPAAEVR